jgi:hypothetical protein
MLFCLGYKQYGSFERHIFYDNRDNWDHTIYAAKNWEW